MHQRKGVVVTLSTLLLSSFSGATEISTCLDVECPIEEGTVSANCQVANQTLITVGISSFSASIPGQDEDLKLSWTVGGRSYENVKDEDRYIERVYYLGTPSSVDLKANDLGYDSCAFYMTGPENKSLFYKNDPKPDSNSHCRERLTDECVSALNNKLSSLAEKQTLDSAQDKVCSKIASGLQSNIPSSCGPLENVIVRGVALTGPSAEEPLTENQNRSSNCYPTLPKTNDLTRQFSYNISSSMYGNETAPAIEGETPILSMFWSNKGDAIEKPSIQLTCVRPIDETTASDETKVGDGGDDKGDSVRTNGGTNILGIAVTAGIVVIFSSLF